MEDKPLRGKDWHRSHNCCSGRCFGEPRGAPKRSRTRSAVAAAMRDRAAHSCAPSTRQTKSPGRSLSGSGRPHRGQFLLICTGHGNNECLSLPKNGGASTGTTNGRGREDRYLPPPSPFGVLLLGKSPPRRGPAVPEGQDAARAGGEGCGCPFPGCPRGPCRAPAVQRGGAERRGRCEGREPGTTTALPLSLPRAAVARRGGPGARPLGRAPLLGTPSALPPLQDPAGNQRAPLSSAQPGQPRPEPDGDKGTPRGAEPPSGPELRAPGPASPAGKRGRIAAQSLRQPGLGVRRGLTRK